jgi:acetyl esterase/lipase
MPLDPAAKNLLDLLVAANRPKIWEVGAVEGRKASRQLTLLADAKDVPIGGVENGAWPGPAGPLPYRMYRPLDAAPGPLPALVYFHGGGFVIGDLDTTEGLCRMLANASGCRVISMEYRLAPEHRFPAAIEDAYAAVSWVAGHARALGIDADRIAIGGDSAGANLATITCQTAKQRGAPNLALQLLLYPTTDATTETPSRRALAEGYLLEKKSIDWFFAQYVPAGIEAADPRISPLLAANLSGLPPAHIHTAEFDPLRDEGKAYADRLAAAGVEVEYTCHPGMIHHFFCLGGAIPYAARAIAEAGAAMKQTLARSPASTPEKTRAAI